MLGILYNIFLMSIFGSIVFILFKIINIFIRSYFNSTWYYAVLKCTLAMFLIPIIKLNEFFMLFLTEKTNYLMSEIKELEITQDFMIDTLDMAKETILTEDILHKIALIWILGFVIFITWQIICFIRFKKSIKDNQPTIDKNLISMFNEIKRKLNINGDIKISIVNLSIPPMLVGLANPTILLPQKNTDDSDMRLILNHELIHFKRKDLWVKFILIFINAIHWFNPIIYHLSNELDKWCEYSCDEIVVNNLNHQERKRYGMAILNSVVTKSIPKSVSSVSFIITNSNLEKRLENMLNYKRMKKPKKLLSIIVVVLVLSCGLASVFAVEGSLKETIPIDASKKELIETKDKVLETIKDKPSKNEYVKNMDGIKTKTLKLTNIDDLRGTGNIRWNVKGNNEVYCTNWLSMGHGDSIKINLSYSPNSSIEIGIVEPNGTIRYVTGSSGSVSYSFHIIQSGAYSIYMNNKDNPEILVTGFIEW